MTNHDKIISKSIFANIKVKTKYIANVNRYSNITNYLLNRFDYVESLNESCYRIKYGIEVRPTCKECGDKVDYINKGKYKIFCSKHCANKYTLNHYSEEKRKEIAQKKRDSQKDVDKENLRRQRIKDEYNSRSEIDKQNRINKIKKYWSEHPEEKKESHKKMGLTNKNKSYILKQQKLNREIETKRKNHTFSISKPEEDLYKELVNKYGKDDVIRQYKSDVYPFACDFYIKSKDLYVELQGMWTHGKHAFNPNSKEDILILEQWKEKAKTSKFYKNAIETWTVRDVNKREIAKKNNLNFIEIF